VYYFLGIAFKQDFTRWIPGLLSFALIIFLIIKWAKDMNHNVTYGNCFGYGFKMVAASTVIVFVFVLIFCFGFFPITKHSLWIPCAKI